MDKSKKILLVVVAAGVIGIFLAMAVVFRTADKKAETKSDAPVPANTEAKLCDGFDWCGIDTLKVPDAVKLQIKGDFLKLSIESNAFTGNPFQNTHMSIPDYISFMDNFYKDPNNREIPTFFILKMGDMTGGNMDSAAAVAYKLKIAQTLKDSGLIK